MIVEAYLDCLTIFYQRLQSLDAKLAVNPDEDSDEESEDSDGGFCVTTVPSRHVVVVLVLLLLLVMMMMVMTTTLLWLSVVFASRFSSTLHLTSSRAMCLFC